MKHKLLCTLGLVVLVMAAFAATPAGAQTTANGSYYATPSWDQQLPASTRFIVLSNWGSAAVLDKETGLVWERSPRAIPFPWVQAQGQCNLQALGNRMGWRLPTLQELASLVDPDPSVPCFSTALPIGHPFLNVRTSYWSATTSADSASLAWFVRFANGLCLNLDFAGVQDKSDDTLFVWCVCGGQGVDPQ